MIARHGITPEQIGSAGSAACTAAYWIFITLIAIGDKPRLPWERALGRASAYALLVFAVNVLWSAFKP